MARLLHLDASPRGPLSLSRELSRRFVDTWLARHPGTAVTYRDLDVRPPSQITGPWIAAAFTDPAHRTATQRDLLAESDRLVDELLAADVIVAGMPMYNFAAPAPFKLWVDQIVRAGRTFLPGPKGSEGLAGGRRFVGCIASAFDYGPGAPAEAMNHLAPWLRTVCGFIGITDIQLFTALDTDRERTVARALTAMQRAVR
jgi:FMN-dependent NADH-azoreductase